MTWVFWLIVLSLASIAVTVTLYLLGVPGFFLFLAFPLVLWPWRRKAT